MLDYRGHRLALFIAEYVDMTSPTLNLKTASGEDIKSAKIHGEGRGSRCSFAHSDRFRVSFVCPCAVWKADSSGKPLEFYSGY